MSIRAEKSHLRRAKGQVNEDRSLWLPDVQRGIAVCGAPGSGKTFSVINPTIRSALDQGTPEIVYDCKYPDQTEVLVAYAARRSYSLSVSIFHKPANEPLPFTVAGDVGGERVYEEYKRSGEAGGV